jgi:sugar phosphate isomerase/epimerase
VLVKVKKMAIPQLKFFRALWGAEAQFSTDINLLFAEFHRLGYTGVEVTLSDIHRISSNDNDAFRRALNDNQLELIGLVQTTYPTIKDGIWQDLSIDQHVANLEYHFEEFKQYKLTHVNIQGGQDSWSVEENEEFFEKALEVQAKYPQVTSSHEVSIISCFTLDRHLFL